MKKITFYEAKLSDIHEEIWNDINELIETKSNNKKFVLVDGRHYNVVFDKVDMFSAYKDENVVIDFGDCDVEQMLSVYEILTNHFKTY
jgi:hypothetical protein